MSTLLQMLRVAFWMWPLQKVLTLLGFAVTAFALLVRPASATSGGNLPLVFLGFSLVVFPVVLAGGALWRMLSAPRIVTLAPHGRARLLFGALGVLLAGTLLWLAGYALFFSQAPPQFRPPAIHFYQMFMLTLAFGTLWGLGSFFASLSPWAMLITLLAFNAPGFLLRHYGIENMGHIWGSPWGLPMLAAIWVTFGIWYLRARRIESPRWMVAGEARAGLVGALRRLPRDHNEALDRLLLAGSSPLHQALAWTATILLLIAVQLLVARLHGNDRPDVTARMVFANLILVGCALMFAGARILLRVRPVWLVTGETRAGLFRRAERLLLRMALLLALFLGALFTLLWALLRPLPASLAYAGAALVLWGLWACYVSLNMLRPGWNLIQALLIGAFLVVLVVVQMAPLFTDAGTVPWGWLALLAVSTVLTRQLARARWARADWPRTPIASRGPGA